MRRVFRLSAPAFRLFAALPPASAQERARKTPPGPYASGGGDAEETEEEGEGNSKES